MMESIKIEYSHHSQQDSNNNEGLKNKNILKKTCLVFRNFSLLSRQRKLCRIYRDDKG